MPFGPKGAPAHFQRMVQISIEAVQNGRILVYIDDILVAGDDPREVWERTMDVLRALAKAGFMINIRKSKFCEPATKIVGVHITRQMYSVIPKPVVRLFGTKPPRSYRQV